MVQAQQAMRTEELDYDLPQGLIATRPVEPRDSARMLVMIRSGVGGMLEHRHVRDLPEYLRAGDALVFNTTAVIPARLIGRRSDTGGKVEGLFLGEQPAGNGSILWQVMLKSGSRLTAGRRIELLDHRREASGFNLELLEPQGDAWLARLAPGRSSREILDVVGWTPLPPYILHARGGESVADELDRRWYQTVYAQAEHGRSVAAPTAGLHFTPQLLQRLVDSGVQRVDVTLHVGAGTFKPITAPTLDQHRMHSEWFEVSSQTLAALSRLRLRTPSSRIIAVGTTSVRTLESLPPLSGVRCQVSGASDGGETSQAPGNASPDTCHLAPDTSLPGQFCGPISGMTDLMIAPPYEFKLVDGMLTNFHLPRSTLLALVAAMVGLDRLKAVYREAIQRGYRFYSYGDAMLILP